jgi:hypothetical protein
MTTYVLAFGYSASPAYARAMTLARSLPGYRAEGEARLVRDRVPITGNDLTACEVLLALVRGWRSTVVLADELPLERRRLWTLERVLACYSERASSGLEELYCSGLLGTRDGRLPCRLVDSALPWILSGPYRDHTLLPRLLLAHARQKLVEICPVYDHAGLTAAAFEYLERTPTGTEPGGLTLRLEYRSSEDAAFADGAADERDRLQRLLHDVDLGPDT